MYVLKYEIYVSLATEQTLLKVNEKSHERKFGKTRCHTPGKNVWNFKIHTLILKYLELDQEAVYSNICTVQMKNKSSAPCTGVLEAQRVTGVWGSQISRQLAHECGKVVSPSYRPPLPPTKYYFPFLL
jgi:hypothetical protein